jgi:hypothetical protein
MIPQLLNITLTLVSCCALFASGAIFFTRETLAQELSPPPNRSSSIVDIELGYGYGVTINFLGVNETVTKIWIDDPSFLTISVDGCLTGLSQNCEQPGAKLIHLRRIEPLTIPQIPHIGRTLMTVVTNSHQGQKLYLFEIAKTDQISSSKFIIDIIPNTTEELIP